jgi:hypothetical protein
MFTHLSSRTVFIDNDRYAGEDWLGYWIAHELGHLARTAPRKMTPKKQPASFASDSKTRGYSKTPQARRRDVR